MAALPLENDLFADDLFARDYGATHLDTHVVSHLDNAAPQPPRSQRISEFVFPNAGPLPLSLVLTMLGHLSHSSDSRWLSCIGLPHTSKRECLQSGLDWQRFLQVFPSSKVAVLELTERVLQAGRSHTVVAWLPASLSEKDLARLEQAAAAGNCQGILIRHR